ncbi:hypothetical protein Pla22_29640 [Rubripirellula amarantea]|uniref:Uncharacterized protein n=1 Tax=Rubripirellula amarantea TaxID=2527999 RepID=A0A5C5WJT0_9BACT|nr:hypothetical protein [Rubripirellula amarantea]TWT50223.1 hypothetical protein Pla22_29640 [Rubripirellula amarantea]
MTKRRMGLRMRHRFEKCAARLIATQLVVTRLVATWLIVARLTVPGLTVTCLVFTKVIVTLLQHRHFVVRPTISVQERRYVQQLIERLERQQDTSLQGIQQETRS